MRLDAAKEAGVHLAMKGTIQGRSGWYQDFEGNASYFTVNEQAEWTRVCTWQEWQEHRRAVDAEPDTTKGVIQGGREQAPSGTPRAGLAVPTT